jgi:hypothetical protein
MAQVTGNLSSKCETLTLNPSTAKKKKNVEVFDYREKVHFSDMHLRIIRIQMTFKSVTQIKLWKELQ